MPSASKTLYLPDTLENWPWSREINPYYEEVKPESLAWFRSFNPFSARSQYAFDRCDFELLAALAYPRASKEQLRSACDMMNLTFAFDEYTDFEPQPVVREMADIVIDAMKNPHEPRPQGEVILGEIARQFWGSTVKIATETAQSHFMDGITSWLESVVQEAADREVKRNHSIASYLVCRRRGIGTGFVYPIYEFHLNIPDEVVYHPEIAKLTGYATDMSLLDNDMLSYNKEQAIGNGSYNILPVIMRELNVDLDGAMDWAAKYHIELQKKFLDGLKQLPSWGEELDRQVEEYLNGVANWVRGNVSWCFEGGRYFGDKGLEEVQKTRRAALLPKRVLNLDDASMRQENIVLSIIEDLECAA